MDAIRGMLRKLRADARGATAVEYCLIAGLIALTMLAGLSLLGGGAGGMWTGISQDVVAAS